jgi:hypothetical protein
MMVNHHSGEVHFESTMSWLEGAYKITGQAIPKGSISLVFKSDGDVAVFSALKNALHMRDVMLESHRRGNISRPLITQNYSYWNYDFSFPWDLPDWLPGIVADLDEGSAHGIMYDGQIPEEYTTPNSDEMMAWSLDEWGKKWRNFLIRIPYVTNTPGGGTREIGFADPWSR